MTHLDPNANRAHLVLLIVAVLIPLVFWGAGLWAAFADH